MRSMFGAGLIALSGSTALAAGQDALPALDPGQVASGRAIYGQYCASCHGANGEGAAGWRQPDAQGDLPAPPHDATGHTWRHADAALYDMVAKGWRDPFNKTETLTMPAFDGLLPPPGIAAVITYLKSLWTPEQRQFQIEESQGRPFPAGTE